MARRVCGASEERDSLSASRCWCRGLFCGRGGFRETQRFQRQCRNTTPAFSRAEFAELLAQGDLIDGDAVREQWLARVDGRVPVTRHKGETMAADGRPGELVTVPVDQDDNLLEQLFKSVSRIELGVDATSAAVAGLTEMVRAGSPEPLNESDAECLRAMGKTLDLAQQCDMMTLPVARTTLARWYGIARRLLPEER